MAWIYDKNGQQKCEIKRLSYTGTFMEVSRIMVTVESPEPIDFAIGDYIDWAYDGLRYKLDTAAGVEKQARKNSIGNAFIYENLVFLSPLNDANHVDFFDVVLGNTIEFLTNTAFSFYGTAWDYAKRLEANLGRITNDNWKIRIWTNGVCYDDSPATGIDTGAWESKLVDVSGIKCLEGFQQIYNLWGCAYVFSVVSGVNYVDFYDDFEQYAKTWQVGGVDKIFAYGKGNGLYKIRHTPDADHVLVTRLRAYGSSENLPANYYFNSPDYHVSGNESSELAISHLMLPASQWEKMGDKSPANAYLDSNIGLYGVREGVVLWDGSDSELGEIKPTIYGLTIQDLLNLMSSGDTYRPVEAKWPDTTQRIDKIVIGAAPTDNGAVAEAGYDYTETESIGSLSSHSFGATQVNRDIQFDDLVMGTTPSVSHLADFRIVPTSENKVAVSFDIPDTIASLIDNVTAYLIPYVGGVKVEDATVPCFVSEESIYITSGGVSYTKRYKVSLLDSTGNPIVFATMLTGAVTFHIVGHINFRAGMEPDNSFPVVRNEYSVSFSLLRGNKAIDKFFSVTVPQIGFDLAAAVSGSSKLCMRSGANQPREFAIVPSSVRYNESTDTWYIKCKRSVDQSTKTYFPNSDAVIASGDEYYLSGIAMPSLYVEIAAQKLLEAAIAWLQYHSNPRMLSSVEVDNKIMAEEGIVLKEGMALPITDADLGITTVNQESRVIDNIRIEEGTDSIRTFSITLRDKKEKSSLDAAIRGATSDFATNSSVSEAVNAAVNTGHGSLTGRDLPNQHPISSISGLEEKLSSLSFFEQYVLPGNAGVAIKLRDEYVGLFSNGWVSSGGISESGGGGGGSVNALRDWANYRPDDTTQVLGSNLGKGLKDDITTLQGYFTNGVADYADDANTLGGHASTYFAHTVRLGSTDYSASNGLINIPSITTGVISDLETWIANKGFVTKAVNDLTNYYLKSQTYTQAEVNALIAAINQFRYEIAASTSAVVNPQPNVLYLIGPIGSGSDRYEEYVYPNATTGWTKIGDTSIDLSGYINSVVASGSGNYITGFSKSGSTLTLSFGTIASWALSANKPSYTFSEIGSKPTTLVGYGITDAYFMPRTADADKVGIVLGDTVEDVLIKHQSLTGYVNTVAATAESSVYECSDCDYVYNPANGDPVGGIAPGTAWDDVPSDWVCPICGASKDDFSEGNQFVYNVIKGTNSSTITFGFRRLRLKNIDGTDDLKAIEALTGTSGLLRKTGSNTWSLDTTQYITKDVNNLTNYYTKGQTYTKTEVDARVFFEEYTLPNNGGTAIKLKDAYVGMFASGFVSSGGISTAGGGGGTTVNALRDWANYRADDTTQVLGSNLGKGLKDSIETLQGYFTNGVANNAANSDTLAGHASTYYAHQVNLGSTTYAASNGIVSLPAYPTTLPASDVYPWAKASTKPSYTFSEIGSKPTTLLGYGITDTYFGVRVQDADRVPLTIGSTTENVLIAHQSLTGYVNNVASSGQEDAYTCPVCGYRYDPSAGDPDAGIAPGTSFADLPTDWECPICQTGKDEFELGGTQYVKAVSKNASSSTIIFTEGRVSLADIDGANSLKGIAYLSGTTGVLKKTGPTTWELDPNAFPTSARELTDADDLCYVDPDEGVSVTIDDPGVTGTVLWGAESANQVALSVNGVSKLLLKAASIAGIESSISTLSGYFINGSARNALSLGGYNASYFASASGLTALQEVVAGKQDTINDLANIRSGAGHGETAYGWGNHASAGYATQNYVNTALADYVDCITLDGVTYLPQNGEIALPDYPTTLPASDVYAWAKKSALDVNDIPSITTGKISDLETWIGNKGFITKAVNDLTNYYLKSETYTQTEVNNLIAAINQFHYEIYASTSAVTNPQSNVLYLIGPTGSGSDRYEEYVYSNSAWVKIGDTSIDLTGYVNAISTTGTGFVSGVSKAAGSSTISFTFTTIYDWALAANKPSYDFVEIGHKPSTLFGYGITDAKIENGVITLGSNTITPLTSHQSLVGYVNAISPSAETDVHLCPDCDYFYDPAIGDPIGGIAAGTAFADLPSEWVCPICGASKEDFTQGGRQFVSGVSKSSGSSTIAFTLNRLALRDLSGANNLKAIEYASGSGLLKKNADGTWGFDTNSYLTGITSAMVTGALGYTPFNAANFTQAIIKSTLGISDWALAASKPSYAFSELTSHPTTLSGYGIIDAAAASDLLAYLPLSGGSMTGDITFEPGTAMFSIVNSSEVALGSFWFDSTNGLTFSPEADVNYRFLHSGNFSSFALSLSGGTMANTNLVANLNADLLDGHEGSYFATASSLSDYVAKSGSTMTGQLQVPSLRINGLTTDYVELSSLSGTLYVGAGALARPVLDTSNWSTYVTKSSLGLGNVENTALSTWPGSLNITTLGTITAGVWQGTPIADEYIAFDLSFVDERDSAIYDSEDYVHMN